jgi:ornithine cyclodeaminase
MRQKMTTRSNTRIDFRYLSEEDMIRAGVTDMGACVEVMEEMFRVMADGDYMMAGENGDSHGAMVTFPTDPPFPNMPKDGPDRRFMAMPAYLGGKFNIAGMKWYGSNIENKELGLPRSILMVMLNDVATGAPIALMSANLLSAYRTGAVPGVGAKYLAPEDAKTVAIIGPGVMNRTSLASFMYARPGIEALKIKGRSRSGIESFLVFVDENYPEIKKVEVYDDMEAACKDADIISFGTTSIMGMEYYPFLEEKWIKPGALVSAPACMRVDDGFLASRARKVLEKYGLYECWANDYPYPSFDSVGIIGVRYFDLLRDGKIKREDIIELGDIVNGKAPAREYEDQVVINSVGGMPVEDLAWGLYCYNNAVKRGLGASLNLWEKPSLA